MTKEEALQKIKELEEFIKEQDKPKKEMFPRADVGEDYYYLNSQGEPKEMVEDYHEVDIAYHDIHNYYLTREEAQEEFDYTKARRKLQNIAKFLNNGWEPDWNNNTVKYYLITYSSLGRTAVSYMINENNGAIHFKTRELAEKARDLMTGDELNIIFRRKT